MLTVGTKSHVLPLTILNVLLRGERIFTMNRKKKGKKRKKEKRSATFSRSSYNDHTTEI